MFVYLVKKIAIPHCSKLHSLGWNANEGWISTGGEDGLLKVLKLDTNTGGSSTNTSSIGMGSNNKLWNTFGNNLWSTGLFGNSTSQFNNTTSASNANGPRGIAACSNLTFKQTLEGHKGAVLCVRWNNSHRKLTTSDENGLIIVWNFNKAQWRREMVNNRNKSVVKDMKWTVDGEKICIVYEDGMVILGSVDGNRLWGKDLQTSLKFVEWFPDGKTILFVTGESEIVLYNSLGSRLRTVYLSILDTLSIDEKESLEIVGIHWFGGSHTANGITTIHVAGGISGTSGADNNPTASSGMSNSVTDAAATTGPNNINKGTTPFTLAIAFNIGKIQLSRGIEDKSPYILDCGMHISQCVWNHTGSVLAVSCRPFHDNDGVDGNYPSHHPTPGRKNKRNGNNNNNNNISLVQFYDCYGNFLKNMKVPGSNVSSLSWEGSGLRIALAAEAHIYFANVRPDYKWCTIDDGGVIVYAYNKPDRVDTSIVFWDCKTNNRSIKQMSSVKHIKGCGDFALVIVSNGENSSTLILCNAIGVALETRDIKLNALFVAMNAHYVVVSDQRNVYCWQYKMTSDSNMILGGIVSEETLVSTSKMSSNTERIFDIDFDSQTPAQSLNGYKYKRTTIANSICSLAMSSQALFVGRKQSKSIKIFSLPHFCREEDRSLGKKTSVPHILQPNSNSTKLGVIDHDGLFTILNLEEDIEEDGSGGISSKNKKNKIGSSSDGGGGSSNEDEKDIDSDASNDLDDEEEDLEGMMNFVRRDVWDMKWAEDDPNSFCLMEKARLFAYRYEESPISDIDCPIYFPMTCGEPVTTNGYLSTFKSLEIMCVNLDEILTSTNPDAPDKEWAIMSHETKPLKDFRALLSNSTSTSTTKQPTAAANNQNNSNKNSLLGSQNNNNNNHKNINSNMNDSYGNENPNTNYEKAISYIEANEDHARLWDVLATVAIENLDLSIAERAVVKTENYQRIQLIQKLRQMTDKMKQRAEVAAHFGRFDEAESIYLEIDRKDLAISLRERIGDWNRMVQLLQNGGGDDAQYIRACTNIADSYAESFKWGKAAQMYAQAKNYEKLAQCFLRMEDYNSLVRLIEEIPYSNSNFLIEIGHILQGVGMVQNAADCYVKAGNTKQAIDCCVLLNDWERAVELATVYNFPQIEGILQKQVHFLMMTGERLKAIEVYRKANRATDAAHVLASLAEEVGRQGVNPLRAKKLHVLAALEVEKFRKKMLDNTLQAVTNNQGGGNNASAAMTTAQTLDNLMTVDREAGKSKVFDNVWRGASAYHYYLLAHRQLYKGNAEAAMLTAIRLAEFEDILGSRDVYSLIALAAFKCQYFGICSRAFIKLENIGASTSTYGANETNSIDSYFTEEVAKAIGQSASELDSMDVGTYADKVQTLAVSIFTRFPPYDPAPLGAEYLRCLETGSPYQACTVTGRSLEDTFHTRTRIFTCKTCRHSAIETELVSFQNCPLCHSSLV